MFGDLNARFSRQEEGFRVIINLPEHFLSSILCLNVIFSQQVKELMLSENSICRPLQVKYIF